MDEAKLRMNQKMSIESEISFEHCSIVACGTLSMELNQLKRSGFLKARGPQGVGAAVGGPNR